MCRGRSGSHLVQVLTSSLSSYSYNLKLVTPLLTSVVYFLPQICFFYFLICSGLEKSGCHHKFCFGFSCKLLRPTMAGTS